VFFGLLGLIKYPAITHEMIQNISDDKKEFRDTLTVEGIPKVICDLLFEKYVATKKRVKASFIQDSQIPVDGITSDRKSINRESLVQSVIDTAKLDHFVVIGSPPATGKTSLMQLIQADLEKQGEKVFFLPLRQSRGDVDWLFSRLVDGVGVNLRDRELTEKALGNLEQVWILIDDAQNGYDKVYWPFWEALVKDLHTVNKKLRCVVAATYDLVSIGSPVVFKHLPHISSLALSTTEADELFVKLSRNQEWASWETFKSNLKTIAGGNVGVFVQGIVMLQKMNLETPRRILSEDRALSQLRSSEYFSWLSRCFPHPQWFEPKHSDVVRNAIISGANGNFVKDLDNPELRILVRGGVLTVHGKFTCLAAEWYYYNQLFPRRAVAAPETIDDMIVECVKLFSSSRLKASCNEDRFPKEAAFQQLFNETISSLLPSNNTITPEFDTKALLDGKEVTGELDFYINGDLQWALELLRNGDRLQEHMRRFDFESGKYRQIELKAYLVVDCRGPKRPKWSRNVSPEKKDLCTLYFSEDFKTCTCVMHNKEDKLVRLQA